MASVRHCVWWHSPPFPLSFWSSTKPECHLVGAPRSVRYTGVGVQLPGYQPLPLPLRAETYRCYPPVYGAGCRRGTKGGGMGKRVIRDSSKSRSNPAACVPVYLPVLPSFPGLSMAPPSRVDGCEQPGGSPPDPCTPVLWTGSPYLSPALLKIMHDRVPIKWVWHTAGSDSNPCTVLRLIKTLFSLIYLCFERRSTVFCHPQKPSWGDQGEDFLLGSETQSWPGGLDGFPAPSF